ncbi:MAG: NADH-quinone oxidoreductase subunit F [Nitrospirae bacterium CG_4_10_14_0_8_um_filter_41_23]|nr:NADH-quinone oxidoreductase subunit NuoF [Nitrospirota bacterium]OIP61107.1 MAG: NADH dehydrogenase [Nitrospirae bacterium CG2_30_41_42]PIQ93809.1 MAG: NADH-quinone oxidoreductase subunit F [Nitrospirae bacterium CG11_big_fil_rev_8_21_14_0_20_41_14]PIV42410.1 MAG: NADH-quinone oxidoreductase subunit F [Nitrospirae bacterium CG02_land_8_20_14_3_00_41_53]PIW88316.1 MAG: NADH-quinone oxidoreductase subunit F [Nitrospirae bacterium CG_4_8_14_3_um_filter_41_47]PIY86129.1 MAG: NADH-quinone oxidor
MRADIKIKVCMGPGGIAKGGADVIEAIKKEINSTGKKAMIEKRCSLHQVGCLGFCAKDVLVEVIINGNKTTYEHIKPDMIPRIVKEHLVEGKPVTEWAVGEEYRNFHKKQIKVVLSHCGEIDPEDINAYIAAGGYEAAKKALTSMSPEKVVEVVNASKLRGRGGAGFPTGLKWELSLKIKSEVKYIICNGDEGDPGAFMDRSVMEGDPHSIIEGMIICAKATMSQHGFIYVRAEYPLAVKRLQLAIDQCYEAGLLGKNILGTGCNFDLKIFQGAGAFVCGEATALMRSIEGKRGMPTPKLWRSAVKGLWDKPTVLNNVETFANVPQIILKGADWFRNLGTERSGGTKVFALTGKVKNAGLIEVPLGISLREIIYDIGGGIEGDRKFKAVQTGGPSGGCIPAGFLDIEVDYEPLALAGSIMGSGGMIVLDETDCMVNTAKFFLEFTQAESCGKCTPCRIGTKRLLEILERITSGKGKKGDIELLEELSEDIKATSLCGLGMTAPNPVLSTIKYFRNEYEAHIIDKKCPAAVCKDLIKYFILEKVCKGCGACKRVCPADAIRGIKKKPHRIDSNLCVKCGTCFYACKFKAIMKI